MAKLYEHKHFTATVFLLNGDEMLLVNHPKLHKWLPPGGHCEPNELPTETAVREVKEEVGIDIEFPLKDLKDAYEIPSPNFILVEDLKDHNHIDFVYIAQVPSKEFKLNREVKEAKWFKLDEIERLNTYENVKSVAKRILQEHSFV